MAINNTIFYDVDYESIKANLKYYLQNNSVLTDYNFEGSAISTWLNLMSYIIFYINTTSNFIANELFIASASIDTNIYKHAYQLNYLPKRKKAISISVKIEMDENEIDNPIPLPVHTNFKLNEDYNFVNLTHYPDLRKIDHIVLYEGEIVDTNKITDLPGYPLYFNGDDYETFTLPDKEDVDRNYFNVYTIDKDQKLKKWTSVFENKNYYQASNYFIRYLDSFQIMFDANESLFSLPEIGDNVQIIYLKTHGAEYNGFKVEENTELELVDTFENSEHISFIVEDTELSGGLNEESLESIASHAPLFYTTGGRCVTEDDYNNLIMSSDLYELMTNTVVYSGHKDVVDYDENPQRVLEAGLKLDKGFFIWSAFKKIIEDDETIFYDIPKLVDFWNLYKFFDDYRFMQVFGKYRMSNILQIQPVIYYTFRRGATPNNDLIDKDIQEFLTNNNYIGYNKSINQTDLIDFLRDTYNYMSYITVDFKTTIISLRPFANLILSNIDGLIDKNEDEIYSFECNGLEGIIYRVDEIINKIVVKLNDDCQGHFDDSFIGQTIKINGEITDKEIIKSPFDKIIIRLNKFVKSINAYVDGKYIICEEYDGTSEDNDIIFKEGTSLDDIIIEPGDDVIGKIYYKEGYIEINNVFSWDNYLNLPINVKFIDGIINNVKYRKNDITVSFETALDFVHGEYTSDVE